MTIPFDIYATFSDWPNNFYFIFKKSRFSISLFLSPPPLFNVPNVSFVFFSPQIRKQTYFPNNRSIQQQSARVLWEESDIIFSRWPGSSKSGVFNLDRGWLSPWDRCEGGGGGWGGLKELLSPWTTSVHRFPPFFWRRCSVKMETEGRLLLYKISQGHIFVTSFSLALNG